MTDLVLILEEKVRKIKKIYDLISLNLSSDSERLDDCVV